MLTNNTRLAGGQYIIQRHLDSGAMADVYAATDTLRQTQVALKVLRSQLALDPYFEEYFRREASVLLRLQHPNIVRLYELVRDGELLFLVMDFIVGPTLQQYLYTHKLLPTADVLYIAQALAHALDFAHSHQIVHRDIKPSNVLLATNGAILLSDFGVARVAGSTTTAAGPVGTIAYMAPEQIVGGTITVAADQYSLAVLIWELLTGRRPFVGDTATLKSTTVGERVMEEHLHHPVPTGLLSPQLDQPLRRALSKIAAERYATCAMLVQQLATASDVQPASGQHWLQQVQVAHTPQPPPSPPPPPATWIPQLLTALRWFPVGAIGTVAIFLALALQLGLVTDLTALNGEHTYVWATGDEYTGEWKDNKLNGQGTFTSADGTTYTGAWANNMRNGQGTGTYADGTTYDGAWANNMRNGQGTFTSADGTTYTGAWRDSTRNGQGKATRSDGTTYDGAWENNMRNGQGTGTYADGTTYTGKFKDDKRNGQGTYTDPDGSKYTGEWKDDKRNGQGAITYTDGGKYTGEFKDGKANGQGTMKFADGRNYTGEIKDDKRNGQGTWTSPDGYKYVGGFKDDKYNGQGTETLPDGTKYVGEWKDDKRNGQGTVTFPNGNTTTGEWKDGKLNGQGTLTFADGTTYTGEFKDGNFNGQGTRTFADGGTYIGEFKDNYFNGQGTQTFADGGTYTGEFKGDKFDGQGTMTFPDGTKLTGSWANGKFCTVNNRCILEHAADRLHRARFLVT